MALCLSQRRARSVCRSASRAALEPELPPSSGTLPSGYGPTALCSPGWSSTPSPAPYSVYLPPDASRSQLVLDLLYLLSPAASDERKEKRMGIS